MGGSGPEFTPRRAFSYLDRASVSSLVGGRGVPRVNCPWVGAGGCEVQGLRLGSHTPLTSRMERYLSMPREKAAAHIPLLFIASPSAKDPTWGDRFPGETSGPGEGSWGGKGLSSGNSGSASPDRSTMTVLVPTSYKWFEEWQEEPKGKRSSDYETLKSSFVEASLSAVMKLFPQLEGKVGRPCGYGDRPLGAISPFSFGQE